MVPFPEKLGPENSCGGNAAKNADVKHHHQLVHNSHPGHLLRPHTAHHNIIQKHHQVSDTVLHNNRYSHKENHPVKRFISNK